MVITQRGAAKALCEQNDVEVTLIDALPDPTGVSSYTIMQLLEHCNHRYVGQLSFILSTALSQKEIAFLHLLNHDPFTPFREHRIYHQTKSQ